MTADRNQPRTTAPIFVEEYRTVDKSEWGPGPWQEEPDKAVWIDERTGLDCMIHRNRLGTLCGYVGVGPDHYGHGVDYDVPDVSVHGGLTYAAGCQTTDDPADGICHLPQPGRPDNVWWFGFDCAHANDMASVMAAQYRRLSEEALAKGDAEGARIWDPRIDRSNVYRDFSYVVREVERLARQLEGVRAFDGTEGEEGTSG